MIYTHTNLNVGFNFKEIGEFLLIQKIEYFFIDLYIKLVIKNP